MFARFLVFIHAHPEAIVGIALSVAVLQFSYEIYRVQRRGMTVLFFGVEGEFDLPLSRISSVTREKRLFQEWVRVRYQAEGRDGDLSLHLKDPSAFLQALGTRWAKVPAP